jgi:hypothetical protein
MPTKLVVHESEVVPIEKCPAKLHDDFLTVTDIVVPKPCSV